MMGIVVYWWTKQYARLNLWMFYRKLEVNGIENIPQDKPVIFVANHQNAFMDAILISCTSPRPIHFLVRAGIFHSRFLTWLLGLLNMMPIYRFRDGIGAVKKNDVIIDKCGRLLSNGRALLIFPEGNHDMRRRLRPLRKGMARIAYQAMEQHNFELDIRVVPVGLNFEKHTAFRSNVLVNFGRSIKALEFIKADIDKRQSWQALTDEVSERMRELIVNIGESDDYYQVTAAWQSLRQPQASLAEQLNHDQVLISKLTIDNPCEVSSPKLSSNRWAWLNPIFLYGWINHFISYYTMYIILKKFVWDNTFYASLKFAIGMVLVPFSYCIQAILFYWYVSSNLAIIGLYIVSLPVSGILAHYIYFKKYYPFGK